MISFIYFDIGGVVIRDFSGTYKWSQMKRALGVSEQLDEDFNSFWDKAEREICLGADVESYIPILRHQFGIKVADGYSMLEDFVSRFERNGSIWPVIVKAKTLCQIGLLTDMYPGMLASITNHKLMPDVVWNQVVDSSVVGAKKPDSRIFDIAQRKADVVTETILFVENNKKNIEGATAMGWQTFWYDSSQVTKSSADLLAFLERV